MGWYFKTGSTVFSGRETSRCHLVQPPYSTVEFQALFGHLQLELGAPTGLRMFAILCAGQTCMYRPQVVKQSIYIYISQSLAVVVWYTCTTIHFQCLYHSFITLWCPCCTRAGSVEIFGDSNFLFSHLWCVLSCCNICLYVICVCSCVWLGSPVCYI